MSEAYAGYRFLNDGAGRAGVRFARPFRPVNFTSVQTLDEQALTPPDGCRRSFYFVPMYFDGRVSVLKRAVLDAYPHADTVTYREPVPEGTAYWVGSYGMAWPVDGDRAAMPFVFQQGVPDGV